MSFEINPVLAGTFDAPGYVPAHNFASTAATDDDVSGPDPRRYTQFDRSATDAGTVTNFKFSDLIDMLNPLQHIPVVSSIYRAATGEQINPVARVTGDILFGGLLGGASAVLGGVGAVADAGIEQQTGKDSGGLVLAALFGSDEKQDTTQLADAGNAAAASSGGKPPASQTIELAAAAASPPFVAALAVPASAPVPNTPQPAAFVPAQAASPDANPVAPGTIPLASAKSYPLKQPYGGVMSPVNANSPGNIQAQDVAIALSSGSPGMRLGHTIYTSKLVNGPHPLPPMLSSGAATTPVPAVASTPAPSSVVPVASTSAATVPSSSVNLANTGAIPSAAANKKPYGGVMSPANANSPGNIQAQDVAIALSSGSPGMRLGHTIYTSKLVNGPHPLPPMLSSGAAAPVVTSVPAPSLVVPVASTGTATVPSSSANLANIGAMPSASPNNPLPPDLMQDMMLKALDRYKSIAIGPVNQPGSSVNLTN